MNDQPNSRSKHDPKKSNINLDHPEGNLGLGGRRGVPVAWTGRFSGGPRDGLRRLLPGQATLPREIGRRPSTPWGPPEGAWKELRTGLLGWRYP